MNNNTFTCQICAREIKANSGLIAHHGYQRPFQAHYQTKSCFGARKPPYQKSRNAISQYLVILESALTGEKKKLEKMIINPPAAFRLTKFDYTQMKLVNLTYEKPVDFDPNNLKNSYSDKYDRMFWSEKHQIEYAIKAIEEEILFLNNRFNNWKKI